MAEPQPQSTAGPAESLYVRLEPLRQPFLDRARWAATVSIPSLLPPDGHSKGAKLPKPAQSIVSGGVNTLSGKILTTILPPNMPFFQHELEPATERELAESGGPEVVAAVAEGLSEYDMALVRRMEMDGDRPAIAEALKHEIVAGNVLVHYPSNSPARMYPLSQYVVRRDTATDIVLDIVLREETLWDALPADVQGQLVAPMKDASGAMPAVLLYTHIRKEPDGDFYEVYQECQGKRMDARAGRYPSKPLPWHALRWLKVPGEDYGRGHIEDNEGDIAKLEQLTKAVDAAIQAGAKVVFMVDPGSAASPRDLNRAASGDFVYGRATDINAIQLQKQMDIALATQRLKDLERRCDLAFLRNTAVQRNGERVTAEEIRFMRDELEQALGGTFTVLATDFQTGYLNVKKAQMRRRGEVPSLPEKAVRAMVVGGFDAFGRSRDIQNIDEIVGFTAQAGGPGAVDRYFHVDDLIRTRMALRGMRIKKLLKTPADREADLQQQQQASLMDRAAPQAMGAAGQFAKAAADNPQLQDQLQQAATQIPEQ